MKMPSALVLTGCLILNAHSALADEPSYGSQVGHKALNGFANITTAVLEIPKNIINTTNDSNIAWGFVGGLTKGILNTGGRIVVGGGRIVVGRVDHRRRLRGRVRRARGHGLRRDAAFFV